MKKMFAVLTILFSLSSPAQNDSLISGTHAWNQLKTEKTEAGEKRQILEAKTMHLDYLEIHATTLMPGKAPHPPHSHNDTEELVIINDGSLKVTIKDSSKILASGSVTLIMPGDEHGFVNIGKTPATYFVLRYRSRSTIDSDRGVKAGGSFTVNWNDLVFKERPKGGARQYYERPTAMLKRAEMHVTTLNEGLQSHDPHTHIAEEILLVINGNIEVQIGENHVGATAGDLVFLSSGILHAPKNIGKGQCMYFAIQWQ